MKLLFYRNLFVLFTSVCSFWACKGVKQQEDQLYSRHLQRQVKLTIIHTPIPDDKSNLNLVIFNDGQEFEGLGLKTIVDSLYQMNKLLPVVIVGVHAANRLREYGIPDSDADKADHYDSFFNNELYPFTKKNAGVRKFNTVTIAGFGAGGLSALHIAWNHPDKIGKTAIFSGSFCTKASQGDTITQGIMYQKLRSSRKRPQTKFWFYAGAKGSAGIREDNAYNIEACTSSVVDLLDHKNFTADGDVLYVKGADNGVGSWKAALPAFLQWAVGR